MTCFILLYFKSTNDDDRGQDSLIIKCKRAELFIYLSNQMTTEILSMHITNSDISLKNRSAIKKPNTIKVSLDFGKIPHITTTPLK